MIENKIETGNVNRNCMNKTIKDRFDEKTIQELKCYVYFLKDPLEKTPFYVGKGTNNRVFEHLDCVIKDEGKSDKLDKIREIIQRENDNVVEHIIIRHGLTEKEAYLVEASMIDFLEYLNTGLTNIQGGHHSIEKGLMTSDEIIRYYNAEPLKTMGDDCIIININRSYKRGIDDKAIYNATKASWTIKKDRLVDKEGNNIINYVLSEYHGLIVEVFKVSKWYEEERGFGSKAKSYGKTKKCMSFEGEVAPENIRKQYINKSITKKKGEANIIKYKI
jgi:hypothetical protein